jgi:hypothetical protein
VRDLATVALGTGSNLEVFFEGDRGTGSWVALGGTGGQALEVALGTGSRTSFGGAGVEDRSWIGLGSAL